MTRDLTIDCISVLDSTGLWHGFTPQAETTGKLRLNSTPRLISTIAYTLEISEVLVNRVLRYPRFQRYKDRLIFKQEMIIANGLC